MQLQGLMLRRAKDAVLELPPKLRTWPEHTAAGESRDVVRLLLGRQLGVRRPGGDGGDRARLLALLSTARLKLATAKTQDESVRVFVANMLAGGIGINLIAGRQVVFNDLDWVPANHWQAEDCAYRIGQTNTVHVTYMVASNALDAFVQTVLSTKAALVEAVVEGRALSDAVGASVLDELERMLSAISPHLADLKLEDLGEEDVGRVLRAYSNPGQLHRRPRGRDHRRRGDGRPRGAARTRAGLLPRAPGPLRRGAYPGNRSPLRCRFVRATRDFVPPLNPPRRACRTVPEQPSRLLRLSSPPTAQPPGAT